MTLKRHPMKSTRQKRLTRSASGTKPEMHPEAYAQSRNEEAEIIRQFHQIQKGYSRLMSDVAKELDLVKNWIGNQTAIKTNDLKARLSSKIAKI